MRRPLLCLSALAVATLAAALLWGRALLAGVGVFVGAALCLCLVPAQDRRGLWPLALTPLAVGLLLFLRFSADEALEERLSAAAAPLPGVLTVLEEQALDVGRRYTFLADLRLPDGEDVRCRLSVWRWGALGCVAGDAFHARVTVEPRDAQRSLALQRAYPLGATLIDAEGELLTGSEHPHPLAAFFAGARRALLRRILKLGEGEAGPLLAALLSGDERCLPEESSALFERVGVGHILVVSGQHVAILAGALQALFGRLRLPGRLSAPLLLAALGFYAGVVGGTPSILRGSLMAALGLLAPLWGRRSDSLTSLGAAALCILAGDPYALARPSFQYSFAATLGILALNGPAQRRLRALPAVERWAWANGLSWGLLRLALLSLCAQLGVLPLLVCSGAGIPLWALPANLLCALWLPLLLPLAAVGTALVNIPFLGTALGFLASAGAQLVLASCRWVDSLPGGVLPTDRPEYLPLLLWGVLLAALLLTGAPGRRLGAAALAAALSLALCLGMSAHVRSARRELVVDADAGRVLLWEGGVPYPCELSQAQPAGGPWELIPLPEPVEGTTAYFRGQELLTYLQGHVIIKAEHSAGLRLARTLPRVYLSKKEVSP